MASPFPPAREAELVTWTQNLDAKLTLSPLIYGIAVLQAAYYHTQSAAFILSYNVSQAPLTRSPANVAVKDANKKFLISAARQICGIIQRFPGTTNAMRVDLGLPQRNRIPTPIPVPSSAPMIEIKKVSGRTATLRLMDVANPTKRGRPGNAAGASVFSYIGTTPGATPPADLSAWTFEGNTGRTSIDVTLPNTVPAGATVWFTAFWFNPRKQAGPNTTPISAHLPGGSVGMAA